MNRSETRSLGESIRAFLEQEPDMHEQILEVKVREVMPSILGQVMQFVDRIDVHDGTLTIRTHAGAVRQALMEGQHTLVRRVNDAIQAELIRQVIIR